MRSMLLILRQEIRLSLLQAEGYLKSLRRQENTMDDPIDFVVTWVDGNDSAWRKEKAKYDPSFDKGNTDARYREWDQFHYWFRAVEKYAPWVRRVYLVTWGHVPQWLNLEHPKLVVIKHGDYIPPEYLPTFSSIPIELNMHRIPGLSEHFVYFNDDMYLSRPVQPEDFFVQGLPKYAAIAKPVRNYRYNGPFTHQLFSVIGVVNDVFDVQLSMQKHPERWFSHEYGGNIKHNRKAYQESYLPGMFFSHLGVPFRKSTIESVWKEIPIEMEETSRHRFRTPLDIMHQIFSLWDIMQGDFVPVDSSYYGVKFGALSKDQNEVRKAFLGRQYRMICLNDSIDVTDKNFSEVKRELDGILAEVFPDKSRFEK